MEPQVLQKLAVRRSGLYSIDRIAQQCVTNGGHVYAHLMRATCFKLAFYQRRISEWLPAGGNESRPFCPDQARQSPLSCDSAAIGPVKRPRCSVRRIGNSVGDSQIAPFGTVRGKLLCQSFMSLRSSLGRPRAPKCPCLFGARYRDAPLHQCQAVLCSDIAGR